MYYDQIGIIANANSSAINNFNAWIAQARQQIRRLRESVDTKINSVDCLFGARPSCREMRSRLVDMERGIDQLEIIAISPAPGETLPLIIAHPDRVLTATRNIVAATAEQGKLLSKWVNSSTLERFFNNLSNTFITSVEKSVKFAAETGGKAVAAAVSTPWGFVFTVGIVGAGLIYLSSRVRQ